MTSLANKVRKSTKLSHYEFRGRNKLQENTRKYLKSWYKSKKSAQAEASTTE